MRIPRWQPRFHRRDTFLRAQRGELLRAMPPPHDMSDVAQRQALQTVEELIKRLQPGGLDGNSREVLHNLINAWTEEDTARLDAHRPEWKAVDRILISLARKEVARRQPRYRADHGQAQHALQALTVTYRQLTGKDLGELPSLEPDRPAAGPVRSTLGRLVLSEPPRDQTRTGPLGGDRPDLSPPSANGHRQPRSAGADDPTQGA